MHLLRKIRKKKMPTDGAENSGDNCVSVNDYKLVILLKIIIFKKFYI